MEPTTGTKVVLWGTIGSELMTVFYDLRYMVIGSLVFIAADFWWGYLENGKRREKAKEDNDTLLMEKLRWRWSKAVRRTASKVVEYMTYLFVGAFLGLSVTEPMEICSHVWTAAIGLGVGCSCEIGSIISHIAYVKYGIEIKPIEACKMCIRFFGRLIKIKSQEIGDAVESIANESEKNDVEPLESEAL